jgi:pilus assembly protein Flp/PilA
MLTFFAAMQNFLPQRLLRNERGATAVEYGLIVALIAAVIAGIVATVGTDIEKAFTTIAGDF